MLVPDLYVINVIFLAYKKKTKHEKINFQKFFVIFFLCNFSVRSLLELVSWTWTWTLTLVATMFSFFLPTKS